MGFIISAAAAVYAAISAVVVAVATAVASVVFAIANAVWAGMVYVAGVAVSVYSYCAYPIVCVYNWVSAVGSYLVTTAASYLEGVYVTLKVYADAIVVGIKAFLEAIHFKTLMAIHKIAYIFSKDYRYMVQRVYTDVAEVSKALGLGFGYLILLHRNARTVLLDVSNMMGRSYDLAEVTWLTEYSNYLQKFNTQVDKYTANPASIISDVDEWLVKPAADLKASIMRNIFTVLDSSATVIKDTVTDVTNLRSDFGQLVTDLPPQIRNEIEPRIGDVFRKYDNWIAMDYQPRLKLFDQLISALGIEQTSSRESVSSLVDRLKRPADYLREIDSLDPDIKLEQEEAIHEISSRTASRYVATVEADRAPLIAEFIDQGDALNLPTTPPAWLVPELRGPQRPAKTKVKPRNTWSVGDY